MFDYSSKEIINNLHDSIISDAKQFGEFNFYQLAMSDIVPESLELSLSRTIMQEDIMHPCQWSILNIVDVNKKLSYLYVSSIIGQKIVSKNLDCNFIKNWAIVPATLRKEIIPKFSKI